MLKKTIVYTNPFTNIEVKEDHYFHISKADLLKMEMEENKTTYTDKNGETLTGLRARLTRIMEAENGKEMVKEFEDLIRLAYGKRQRDLFHKSQEIWDNFKSSAAYESFFFEVCTDTDKMTEFINGIIPRNLDEEVQKLQLKVEQSNGASPTPEAVEEEPDDPTGFTNHETPRVLTSSEVAEMDADELKSGLATGRYKLS